MSIPPHSRLERSLTTVLLTINSARLAKLAPESALELIVVSVKQGSPSESGTEPLDKDACYNSRRIHPLNEATAGMDRVFGFPVSAKHFHLYTHDSKLKEHPAYLAAKGGDKEAAFDLVWDLASKFQSKEGYIEGTLVLCNAGRSHEFVASKKVLRLLKERFGDEIRNLFGIKTETLTANEANYLVGFRSLDEIRNRIIKAKKETVERLRSKGIYRENADNGHQGT